MVRLIVYIEQACRNFKIQLKGRCLKIYLQFYGCKVGKGLRCVKFPRFSLVPHKNITIGDRVTIGEHILIEVVKKGSLTINNGVNLTRNVVIVANSSIAIGDNCLVAENVSIRDANHQTQKEKIIHEQDSDIRPIKIGKDVWLGANVVVLKGANVPEGCVIGANSLVLEKSAMEPYGVYGGSPLKLLKMRE